MGNKCQATSVHGCMSRLKVECHATRKFLVELLECFFLIHTMYKTIESRIGLLIEW